MEKTTKEEVKFFFWYDGEDLLDVDEDQFNAQIQEVKEANERYRNVDLGESGQRENEVGEEREDRELAAYYFRFGAAEDWNS